MLNSNATNRMTCTICGWTRVIDHFRSYRGGHIKLGTEATECQGMLEHEQISPDPLPEGTTPDSPIFEEGGEAFLP